MDAACQIGRGSSARRGKRPRPERKPRPRSRSSRSGRTLQLVAPHVEARERRVGADTRRESAGALQPDAVAAHIEPHERRRARGAGQVAADSGAAGAREAGRAK
eukprot:2283280-Prymnesium_polylepis.1